MTASYCISCIAYSLHLLCIDISIFIFSPAKRHALLSPWLKHLSQRLWTVASNQGHCSECDPLSRCSEEEEKKGASHDQCRETRGDTRERERERERLGSTVFSQRRSLAASEETQRRYVPGCLLQVGKVMSVLFSFALQTQTRGDLNTSLVHSVSSVS